MRGQAFRVFRVIDDRRFEGLLSITDIVRVVAWRTAG
jgi:hypothetical protein